MTQKPILAFLLLIPLFSLSQDSARKITLLDGRLEFIVSSRLRPMSNEVFQSKYSDRFARSDLRMMDSAELVAFFTEKTEMKATEEEMAPFALYIYQAYRKKLPTAEFPSQPHGTLMVNGKKMAYLKVFPHSGDPELYDLFYFISIGGKILTLTLICPKSLQKTWEPIIDGMIQTLKIK